jgi:hypothetical protein
MKIIEETTFTVYSSYTEDGIPTGDVIHFGNHGTALVYARGKGFMGNGDAEISKKTFKMVIFDSIKEIEDYQLELKMEKLIGDLSAEELKILKERFL